jgi:hypothetical protein
MNTFSIDSFGSPIRRKSSSISIDFPPWSSNKPVLPLPDELAPSAGLGFLRQHSVQFGSRTGRCIEYVQQGDLTLSAIRADLQPVWITCQFGDVSATFDGTRNAVPEFYEFLESAREVKR